MVSSNLLRINHVAKGIWSTSLEAWIHLIISIILLVVLSGSSETIKYVFAPYVFYLVIRKNIIYIPALIILTSGTSVISSVVFFSTLIALFTSPLKFHNTSLKLIFLVFVSALCIVLFYFIESIIFIGNGLLDSLSSFSYFFGLFPVFYGYQIGCKQKSFDINVIIVPLVISFLFSTVGFPLVSNVHRIQSMLYIMMLSIIFLFLFERRIIRKLPKYLIIASIIYLLVYILREGVKFHILLSVLISFSIVYLRLKDLKWLNNLLTGRFIIASSFALVIFGAVFANQFGGKVNFKEYTDFVNYPIYMQEKLFGDRGVLWMGAWNTLQNEGSLMPPTEKILINFISIRGAYIEEVEYGAHNIILELVLRLGWIVGLATSYILISLTLMIGNIARRVRDPNLLLFVASLFGLVVGGGLTGQYIMKPNFSFLLFISMGLIIGYSKNIAIHRNVHS